MTSESLADRCVDIALGLTLGALIVSAGLWAEARDPQLVGADPHAGVHTVLTDFGFGMRSLDRLSVKQLEEFSAEWPEPQWMGTIRTRQFMIDADEASEISIDMVFGPLLKRLSVPLLGQELSSESTSLPLAPAPVREIVLSRDLASRLFGTPQAAVGQFIGLGTLQWRLGVDDLATFEVVGVVANAFRGSDIERPVDAWMGINGWSDVVFPEHQIGDFRKHFGAHTLLVTVTDPARFGGHLQRRLVAGGEPTPSIALIPGAGYHPERRARFMLLSEAVLFGFASLVLLTITCAGAFAWVRTIREMRTDFLRFAVGETRGGSMRRKLLARLPTAMTVGLTAAAVLFAAFNMQPYGLPLDSAVMRAVAHPVPWLLSGLLIAFLVGFRVARAREFRAIADGVLGPEARYAAFFAVSFNLLAIVLFSGMVSALRAAESLDLRLPDGARSAHIAAIEAADRRWMFDRQPVDAVVNQLSENGVAIAGAGPAGGALVGKRVTITTGESNYPAVIRLNHVSPNFFPITGLSVSGECGSVDTMPLNTVIANERFLQRFGRGLGYDAITIARGEGPPLRICGIVSDAHVGDARAGLAPMLYVPLRERRHARVIVTRGGDVGALARAEAIVSSYFPGTTVASPRRVDEIVRSELSQERGIVMLNVVLIASAALVVLLTSSMLLDSVIRMNLRHLAIRRALGSSMTRLAAITVFGRSPFPWIVGASFTFSAAFIIAFIAEASVRHAVIGLSVALTACLVAALVTTALVPKRLSDQRLARCLARDH